MTQKDYIKFAKIFAKETTLINDSVMERRILQRLKTAVADVFTNDNPRFDREKFYRACEPKKKL